MLNEVPINPVTFHSNYISNIRKEVRTNHKIKITKELRRYAQLDLVKF